MPRRLVLMRHAKSSWSDLGGADHDRPLNLRGRLASALMGAWLREQPWTIDVALISSSARTRETFARMGVEARDLQFQRVLYHAEPDALWGAARTAASEDETVLILAHNPGLEELLSRLPNGPYRVPTGAIAVLEILSDWAHAGPELARIVAYEEPKSMV